MAVILVMVLGFVSLTGMQTDLLPNMNPVSYTHLANQGENLLAPLRAAVGPMVFGNAYAQKHTRITTCTLGYRAGVIGAALLAKNQG